MNFKTLFISILLVVFAFSGIAQNKKDNARFNIISKNYVINNDGSVDYTYHKELKLLSNRSFFRDYGETFIIYNPEFQSVKINEGYSLRADGVKVTLPSNAITESLPYSCTDCERYNDFGEMIVSHTGLELNGTIILDYTVHSRPDFIKDFMETIDFVEFSPVSKYVVTVSVPENLNLKYSAFNFKSTPKITTDTQGNKIYTWTLTNLKQSSSESYFSTSDNYPKLILSTFKDMQMAYFAFINQDALKKVSLPACKRVLSTIVDENKSETDNILAIRDYVVDAIHFNNISMKYNNYKVAPASITFKTACGNEIEKTVLLAAILRHAGFETQVVAFVDEKYHSDEIANLDNLKHFGVRVKNDNGYLLLSAVDKNRTSLENTYNNEMMYILDPTIDHFVAKKLAPIDNVVSMNGLFSIANDGKTSGDIKCAFTSSSIPSFKLLNDNKSASAMVENINGNIQVAYIKDNTVSFTFNTEKIDMKKIGATDYYEIIFPTASNSYKVYPEYLPVKREYDVNCKKTDESYSYTITLPDGCKVIDKMYKKSIEKIFGKMTIEIIPEGNKLTINRSLSLVQNKIELSMYKDFREMMILWNDETHNKVMIKF